jgi:PAS domain S-box-containing protein
LGTGVLYYVFLDPHFSWESKSVAGVFSVLVFGMMGLALTIAYDRIRSTRALLASEVTTTQTLYDGVAEQSVVGTYVIEEGVITQANDEAARIFGCSDRSELLGRSPVDFIAPAGRKRLLEFMYRRARGEIDEFRDSFDVDRADGSSTEIEIHARTTTVEGRRVAVAIVVDVGERNAADRKLAESEALLSTTSRIAMVGGWQFSVPDMRGTWTDEVARIFEVGDVDPAEIGFGRDLCVGTSKEAFALALDGAMHDGKEFDLELEVVTPAGTKKWVRVVGQPVSEDGEIVRVVGATTDVTQRHETRSALETLNERFELAAKASGLGVWDWDLRAGRLYWDDRMYGLYGRAKDEFVVSGSSWLECVHSADREEVQSSLEVAIAAGTPFDRVFRIVYPNGEIHYIKTYSEVSRDASGQPLRLTGVNLDISELKEAEHEVMELNATLERRVELGTAEVMAANKELEAFAYAVSHDLRTPLRAMTGFCRALDEDYGDQLDDNARQYMQFITTAAKNMGELIDGLLVLSRATRGELERVAVDVSAMSLTALEGCAMESPDRNVAWTIEPGIVVHGDPRMVEALLSNLISNAWKYTTGTESAHIKVSKTQEDDREWVCVEDNGAGFDQTYADQLFEPFRRLHRQDEFPGIGIGLATVQRIANRHGGEIRATGEPGKGARFCFWLPSEERPA